MDRNQKDLTQISQIPQLSELECLKIEPVAARFRFRSNEYYLGLIDWDDPNDPIRRIAVPTAEELCDWGEMDASGEETYTVRAGVEHKYPDTALFLVNDDCGGYCRFCFRKRLFTQGNHEVARNLAPGLAYIRAHAEINNVLLTGGDPLLLPTERLRHIVSQVASIPHVQLIRIGSKMPAFNPFRILDDPALPDIIRTYSRDPRRIYIMAHFNHPRELTPPARQALDLLREAGAIVMNQTPLIRGVNDDPETLRELFETLSFIGVAPYYIFQCRPTLGNLPYVVPLEEGYEILETARSRCSGLAARARFAMSHKSGKIEIVGLDEEHVFMRYHRAARPEDNGRFLVYYRDSRARWLDDYSTIPDEFDFELYEEAAEG